MNIPDINEVLEYYPQITSVDPSADLFPLPTSEEFGTLCVDIDEMGLLNPIMLTPEGALIDGRSRLLACYEVRQDIRVEYTEIDPYVISISANLARRNLSTAQKAFIGVKLKEHESELARERQSTLNNEETASGNITLSDTGQARDLAAKKVGVSGSSIDKAETIIDHAPDIVEEVQSGEMSLEKGYKQARKNKASKPSEEVPKPSSVQVEIVSLDGGSVEIDLPKKVVFNRTTDAVSWAKYTWNPITGCRHGCKFCYAEDIATSNRMKALYPFGFEPAFHEYRLSAPVNTKVDGMVFVCSMADLFGKWVPDEWIQKVFKACMDAPEWTYLFLTKWPNRYKMIATLPRGWFGASVIKQSDVARVEREMQSFQTDGIKWVSLEPMLEPIKFNDLSWCDLVVIGSQTSANGQPAFAPDFDWVVDVVNQCRAAGVKYYLKPNLMELPPGMVMPRELPQGAVVG